MTRHDYCYAIELHRKVGAMHALLCDIQTHVDNRPIFDFVYSASTEDTKVVLFEHNYLAHLYLAHHSFTCDLDSEDIRVVRWKDSWGKEAFKAIVIFDPATFSYNDPDTNSMKDYCNKYKNEQLFSDLELCITTLKTAKTSIADVERKLIFQFYENPTLFKHQFNQLRKYMNSAFNDDENLKLIPLLCKEVLIEETNERTRSPSK